MITRAGHFAWALATAARYKLRRGMGARSLPLEQAAVRSWQLAPGITERANPIYMPEAHFGRILRSAPPVKPVADVIGDIRSQVHEASPTQAFVLRDAVLFRHEVYCGLYKGDLFGTLPSSVLVRAPTAELDNAVLATTYAGTKWFGHFLHDELPLQELVPSIGPAIGHVRRIFAHEPGWRSVLQVPAPSSYAVLRARELVWIDDRGQNVGKRARYRALRSRIGPRTGGRERIFLRRAPAPGIDDRQISNSAEIEARLVKEGFDLVDTGEATVDELIRRCAGAAVVVSVEGSHAACAYYLAREGACLFYIYPPDRVSAFMPQLAGFHGLRGAMFVGQPDGAPGHGFRVDPDELLREIERATTFAAQPSALP